MSAEGKKKRGVSGVSNAKNISFRYHGFPKNYSLSTHIGNSNHPRMAGSKLLVAMKNDVWLRNGGGTNSFVPKSRIGDMELVE